MTNDFSGPAGATAPAFSGTAGERRLAAFDRWAGRLLCAFGAVCLGAWIASCFSGMPDDTASGIIVGLWFAPSGAFFLLAYLALRRRWRIRWSLQLLPWIWLGGFWVMFAAVFG